MTLSPGLLFIEFVPLLITEYCALYLPGTFFEARKEIRKDILLVVFVLWLFPFIWQFL